MPALSTLPARARPRVLPLVLAIAAVTAGAAPAAAGAAPLARHLYGVTAGNSSALLVPFDIDAEGAVSERYDHAIPVEGGVQSLVVARDARVVYVGAQGHFDYGHGYSYVPGAVEAYAVAPDGALSLLQRVAVEASQLALTPDGSRLFVRSSAWDIRSYPLAPDGTLGSASATTVAGGGGAMSFVIRPDGKMLYASVFPSFLQQWTIGADGALTTLPPFDLGFYGCQSHYVGVTPDSRVLDGLCQTGTFSFALGDSGSLTQIAAPVSTSAGPFAEDVRGRAVYVAIYPHWVEQVQRQPDGTLLDFPAGVLTEAGTVQALAADPAGRALALSVGPNALELHAIAADGSLASSAAATVATTPDHFDRLAYAPDQPPVAALGATQGDGAVAFDARASRAVNGTIARYDWSFGDGTSLADGGATPSHVYAHPGDYTATVTLTDGVGCSLAGSFNGTMSICAGSPGAAASTSVRVVAASPAAATPDASPEAAASSPADATAEAPRPLAARATPNVRGDKVLLTWAQPAGAAPPTRYLVAWSTLKSAHGPGDTNMHHLYRRGENILLRTRPGTTLHLAVYAQMADGTFTRATKTTLRLGRSR